MQQYPGMISYSACSNPERSFGIKPKPTAIYKHYADLMERTGIHLIEIFEKNTT